MKLSSLTPTVKIKLAAELDGKGDWNMQMLLDEHKNYSTSYNAIIPLIQKQDDDVMLKIEDALGDYLMKSCFWYRATPSQLLDALLVATGKAEL